MGWLKHLVAVAVASPTVYMAVKDYVPAHYQPLVIAVGLALAYLVGVKMPAPASK